MKKALSTLVLGILISVTLSAQEAATYTQYQLFPIFYNPGVTGFSGNHEFLLNARKGLAGFDGTPITYTAMYHGSFGGKLGLGGSIFSEKIGDMTTTKVQGNYAFRFRIQKAQIGIGLTTEFINQRVNANLLSNPLVQTGDAVLEDHTAGRQIFDASAGAHVLWDNKVFVGLAIPNTVRARIDQIPADLPIPVETEQRTNYIFHFGYILDRSNQGYKIIPSIAVRSIRDVPYQVDVNVQGRFLQDKLITGITLRPGSSGIAGFMLGTQVGSAQLVYSYDIAFGPFQQYNTGSHELTVAYTLRPKAPAKTSPNSTK
jgi:type IX secretion system PorP/SprF family membrane protein